MSRRYFHNEWPELMPSLIGYLENNSELPVIKIVFECFKKICKKYRYMFRSDELFIEMNYVIEHLSQHLLNFLIQSVEMAKNPQNHGNEEFVKQLYSIMNSTLHIIESIISQEELPNFYEDNLR